MSNEIFDDGKINVTSYCGAYREGDRTRYQVNIGPSYTVYDNKEDFIEALKNMLSVMS